MKTRCVILTAGLCLAVATSGWAFDTLKMKSGSSAGTVKRITRNEVEWEKNRVPQKTPVNEIETIFFDSEPTGMKTAKTYVLNGRYQDASEALGKVELTSSHGPEVKQDLDYYKAYCMAQLALGGTGTIKDAGGKMIAFVSDRANANSYHFYQACEVVGDLLVASGRFDKAEEYYRLVAQTPWPDFQMRAGVAIGRARLAQPGKLADALKAFEAVLAMPAADELAQAQHLSATLGKARCLAAGGKLQEAIALVDGILAKADPEDVTLHAWAYNTLGTAYRQAKKDREALLAFLHVDVLYINVPEAHAEALFNLAQLWDGLAKTERAVRCRQILADRYPNSRWNKSGG